MVDVTKDWTGAEVQDLLTEFGLSQRGLARMLNLRVMTVNDWITEKAVPSRIASIALTYIALDLAGRMVIRKKKQKE